MTLLLLTALAGCSAPPGAGSQSGVPDGGNTLAADARQDDGSEAIGGRVYRKACFACHQAGLVGAPRLGDAAAWTPRIAQGVETLVAHAVNGFQGDAGVMPPKGGHAYLSEKEIAAAIDYMVRAVR